jgi:hypothetical protein
LEHTVERSHRALRPACGAAFSIDVEGAERLVIVQEVNDRASVPSEDVVAAIRRALTESHEVHPDAIVLIEPRSIPRTSSGKIQRYACRQTFLAGTLEVVHEWRDRESSPERKRNGAVQPRSGLCGLSEHPVLFTSPVRQRERKHQQEWDHKHRQ